MKKLIRITLIITLVTLQLIIPSFSKAQNNVKLQSDTSIHFNSHLSWNNLVAKAKKTHKIIFIDVYTTWCVPCKEMEKEIFPLKKVRAFFNNNFINYRADAEKGTGKKIADKFKVHAYPTFLFVNGDGDLVYKGTGYDKDKDPERFIGMGRKALDGEKETFNLAYYREKYPDNRENKVFIRHYLELLYEQGQPNNKILDHYVDLLPDEGFLDSMNATLIINSVKTSDSKAFRQILHHQRAFANAVEWKKTRFKKWEKGHTNERLLGIALEHIIMPDFMKASFSKNKSLYNTAIRRGYEIEHVGHNFLRQTLPLMKIEFYAHLPDTNRLVEVTFPFADSLMDLPFEKIKAKDQGYFKKKLNKYKNKNMDSATAAYFENHKSIYKHQFSGPVAKYLWRTAKHYDDLIKDKQKLKKALEWIKKAIQLDDKPRERLVYTRLLYKTGNKRKGIREMKDLINAVKKDGKTNKFKSYREELKKMKEGLN